MYQCRVWGLLPFLFVLLVSASSSCHAEVKVKDQGGFQLIIQRSCRCDARRLEKAILEEVGQWWLKDHTYTGDSNNLSFDLQNRCFLESLEDGGFVRHMEVKQYHPGKRLVMTGGMGPLQEMGVQGAMTLKWVTSDQGTTLQLSYNVSGYSPTGLQDLAPIVDMVLSQQMDSPKEYCDTRADGGIPTP